MVHYHYSTLHYFGSFKERLHKLSNKLHPHCHVSATTLAAANEKFVRHQEETKSNEIIIHSEDLTASQFAHLTGIDRKKQIEPIEFDEFDESEIEEDQPSIWESSFWFNHKENSLSQPLTKSISEPNIPSMIQKGRFKIIWGQYQEPEIHHKSIPCVEWKRKRASSHETTL